MPVLSHASRWARLALATGLAALVIPLLPVAGQAANQTLDLAVHVGYHDITRTGQWMPVAVDVHNGGTDFQGTIEVQLQDNSYKGVPIPQAYAQPQAEGAVYLIPFVLASGATKRVRTYIVSDIAGSPLTVRLSTGGRVVASQSASSLSPASILIGVLSDDPTTLDEFAAVRFPSNAQAQVVHLTADDIASSAVYLRAFDLIAIDDFATDSLTPSQRSAIQGYVAMGGNLLLGSGASWRKTLGGLPTALQPMAVSGTTLMAPGGTFAAADSFEVATGPLSGGTAWVRDGGTPLLVEKPVGAGLVTLATFDWVQEPAVSSPATRTLLRQIGIRGGFGTQTNNATAMTTLGVFSPYAGGGSSITQKGNNFVQALSSVPGLALPSLQLTGLLILLYMIVVGPLNYLILLRMRRRELAWITVPVIAVVFAGGAYGLAVAMKGSSVQGTQVAIVHASGGWDQAYQETYTGVYAPTRGDYTIQVLGSHPAIAPIAAIYGTTTAAGDTRVHPDDGAVDLVGVTAFTLRGFATESTVPAPQVSASVMLQGGTLTGVVHNASKLTFTDAIVVAGNTYQRLGTLKPGQDLAINLQTQMTTLYGLPPANFLFYPNSIISDVSAAGNLSPREAAARFAVVQSLLGSSYGTAAPSVSPFLIAWTHDALQGIRVNGNTPQLQSESAVVVPLTLTGLASGSVPAGLLPARLVDASGTVNFGSSAIYLNGGSATYELRAPLVPGAQLQSPSITSVNPYGAKFVPPVSLPPVVVQRGATGGSTGAGAVAPTITGVPVPAPGGVLGPATATLTAELWDWTANEWVPFALKDNTTYALPAGGVDPASGTVRVRLTATSASYPAQMGLLYLAGTVQ